MINSKKSSFLISYDDCPENDNSIISDKIVDILKDPKCQRYLFSVASALFFYLIKFHLVKLYLPKLENLLLQ